MADDHLSVGEREVPTMPEAVGSDPVRVSGPGSGVPGRLGRIQAFAAIGVVAALTAGVLVGLASPAGAVAGYGDVGEGIWYTDAVQWSVDNGIDDIAGPCFGPETPVSRGETAVWIYNMENPPDAGTSHSFTDVTDASQNDAISWMAHNEITTGKSPTTFAPDETLTRAEAATFLHRLADKPSAPPHNFSDVVAGWQQDSVSWMADTGITTGTSPTTFAPEDTLNRSQLITFLYRYKNEPDVTLNTSTPTCDDDAEPDPTPQGAFTAITAGGAHSCGLRTDGTAQCWGHNYYGETDAPTGTFTAITTGGAHSCGLRTDGTAQCWGYNILGQGDAPSGTFTAITAGGFHSCGLRTDGTAQCWGHNNDGQTNAPTGTFTAITAGGFHSCGLRTDGTAQCWGNNSSGQTDAPDRCVHRHHNRRVPFVWAQNRRHRPMLGQQQRRSNRCAHKVRSPPSQPATSHSCGLRTDGTAQCWGNNNDGQTDAPTGTFTAITAGGAHSCGLRTDGTAQCWGNNSSGQTDAPTGTFTAITTGGFHSCGLRTDGTAQCWGYNDDGQGDAPTGTFTAITAGGAHSCGLRTDGTAQCWGSNDDRETDFGQTDAPTGTFTAITAGQYHSCGLRTDGTAQCWGNSRPVKPMRLQARSPPSQPARTIRVGSEPTAPPNAGATTASVKPMRLQVRSPPSQPAGAIRVGSEPTAPPNAGAATSTVKPMRPQARSPPSQPATGIRVGSEPTAPPNAGATTTSVKPMRPQVRLPPSQPASTIRVGSEPTAPPNAGTGPPIFPRALAGCLSRRRDTPSRHVHRAVRAS